MSIPGASNPVVRHSTLATYLTGLLPPLPKRSASTVSPLNRASISARSDAGVSPVTTAHSSPVIRPMSSETLCACATEVQKRITDLRSFVSSAISWQAAVTIPSSPIAASTSSWTNSPPRTWRWSRSARRRPDFETSFERKPRSIISRSPIS